MVRITKSEDHPEQVSFKVEGRLVSAWVDLVEWECRQALKQYRQVDVDFTQVTFADEAGIQALRTLAQDHRIVLRASELINQLLCQKGRLP